MGGVKNILMFHHKNLFIFEIVTLRENVHKIIFVENFTFFNFVFIVFVIKSKVFT